MKMEESITIMSPTKGILDSQKQLYSSSPIGMLKENLLEHLLAGSVRLPSQFPTTGFPLAKAHRTHKAATKAMASQ